MYPMYTDALQHKADAGKTAKVQFVDEGPGLENFYSHDDLNGYLEDNREDVQGTPTSLLPDLLLKKDAHFLDFHNFSLLEIPDITNKY